MVDLDLRSPKSGRNLSSEMATELLEQERTAPQREAVGCAHAHNPTGHGMEDPEARSSSWDLDFSHKKREFTGTKPDFSATRYSKGPAIPPTDPTVDNNGISVE